LPALDHAFGQEIILAGKSLSKEMVAIRVISITEHSPKELKQRAKDMNKAGFCFVCKKGNSKNKCARCKKVPVCGTGCQRKDWKRHKVVECIPPDGK
jgi:hypothetical protein